MKLKQLIAASILSSMVFGFTLCGVTMYKRYSATVSELHTVLDELHKANETLHEANEEILYTNAKLSSEVDKLNKTVDTLATESLDKYNVRKFEITAYSPYDNVSGMENNGDADATSTGMKPGKTVFAVDPKVIPYYSEVIIVYDNGEVLKGIAGDCGGLIKGNIIDVYKDTYRQTVEHGRRSATVIWRSK